MKKGLGIASCDSKHFNVAHTTAVAEANHRGPAKENTHSLLPRAWVLNRFGHVALFATLGTVACQASLSVGLSRQEHWSGLSYPPPGNLPNPGLKPTSL